MLLPSDRYIAELLGLTDEQYELWRDELRLRASKGPQPAVVAGIEISVGTLIINTLISVGFSLIAALLTPTPSRPNPARLNVRQRQGQSQLSASAFAPRAGFDAAQEPAQLGDPIPVIYTLQEQIGGTLYGGVRVNMPLLWSQMLSLGGSQMLRAIFMLGEGTIGEIEPFGLAIGNNLITNYDFTDESENQAASRITVYYRGNGGRITGADRIAGRSANRDDGNFERQGAGDVYMVRSVGNNFGADFCASSKPSTSTKFGVYSLIGSNLGFKLNPTIRPLYTPRLKPRGSKGNADLACDIDRIVEVQRAKFNAFFSTRSGVTSGGTNKGQTFTYRLDRTSDLNTIFLSADVEDGSWSSSKVVAIAPKVFVRESTSETASLNWSGWLSVSGVSVAPGGDALTVTATFDAEAAAARFTAVNAARGRYTTEYWVRAAKGDEVIEAKFDVTVTLQNEKQFTASSSDSGSTFRSYSLSGSQPVGYNLNDSGSNSISIATTINDAGYSGPFITFDAQVDDDSGPVQALSGPLRLQAAINFPIEELDAYSETASDVASSVAALQRSWDDALVVGDMYKWGSAVAVCINKNPGDKVFISDSEEEVVGSGQSINVDFRVIKSGDAQVPGISLLRVGGDEPAERETATSGAHLLKIAIATFATETECRVVEIGYRSTLGIAIGGLMNFRDALTLEDTDGRACLYKEGTNIKRGRALNVDSYQSGVMTLDVERYSFFKVSFRKAGTSDPFLELAPCFGFRGLTRQASFSALRLDMPSQGRWEFRHEPLSGWEIRNGQAQGELVILDSSLRGSEVFGWSGQVRWRATGENVNRNGATFRIEATKRESPGIGLAYVDQNNYLDAWGKLAEGFVYNEVQSSAEQGPEHEVVYVNEIRENPSAPQYGAMAIVGINARSSFEWSQFSQLSARVTRGVEIRRLRNGLTKGPSHLFPDVALDRLTNERYGASSVIDDMIDLDSFRAAADWTYARRYFYDGPVMVGTEPVRRWLADVAPTFLLDLLEINGKYELKPVIEFGPVLHKALFSAGNIAEGSFQYESQSADERQRYRYSVRWRQERSGSDPLSPGAFPEEREVLIREAAPFGSSFDPMESITLSDYVTSEAHAIDYAKFLIRTKRLSTHKIQFRTTYDGVEGISAGIAPRDMIRVALDTVSYDEFNNGAVTSDGALISTTGLSAGSYPAVLWDGSSAQVSDGTLNVAQDGTATPAGVLFAVKQSSARVRSYQITSIRPTEDGTYEIQANYMPTGEDGRMLVAADWDSASAWDIRR